MTKRVLLRINALLIIPFIVFFTKGGNVAIWMLPVWAVMSVVNTLFAQDRKELIALNGAMALFAAIGIWIDAILYFYFICYDSEGVLVMQLETVVMLLYVAVLTLIEYLIRYIIDRIQGKADGR